MNVSIASYAFHGLLAAGKMDIYGYLESCKYRYGVDSADIWIGFLPQIDDGALKKVKEALDERELVLANLCVDGPHIWEDDPAVREAHYKNALEYLHAAEVLKAKTVRIDAGGQGETYTNEQMDTIVKRFKEYAKRAYDNGYKVGPENHWGAEVVPENMKRICEAVDHPGFGMLLHFRGNAGDAVMAPWAMHTHISMEVTMEHLEDSMTMLHKAGYKGYWGVEHHSGANEYTEVAIQVARVKDMLSKW